ncbi:MAG: phosphatidylcholine synthase [Saprospiraceae bacterium]
MSSFTQKLSAWSVHVFTSLGLLAAFMALVSIDNDDWRTTFLWLVLCFIIDALDGSLARKFNVETVLPHMDGKSIDYVIDFAAYAIIPTFFFYKAEMASEIWMFPTVAVMLLSSALYYGKKQMVADEQFFIGFPVLWNFVVYFQFFICHNIQWVNVASVFFFGILHFVPIRFAYPSRSRQFFISHLIISIIGLGAALAILWQYPKTNSILDCVVVLGGIYFIGFAIYDTLRVSEK